MADKEISALPTSGTLNPSDWFHIKQGATDVKMNIGTVLNSHINSANPHNVTKSQVGLANVLDVEQLAKAQNLDDLLDKSVARTNLGVDSSTEVQGKVDAHANLTSNPHGVTKAQVGLANVGNYTTTDNPREDTSEKYATGKAVATLAAEFDASIDPLPIGSIIMWSQNAGAIPAGYALCNGQTVGGIVTPNLTGKFIKASTLGNTGVTGGSNDATHNHTGSTQGHQLTESQIPAHQHATSWGQDGGAKYGSTGESGQFGASGSDSNNLEFLTSIVGGDGETLGVSDPHNHIMSVDSTSIDNQPEFYSLAFIMKYQ